MYITLLDTDFKPIAILDYYESLIWTDRYREFGDFEMYFKMQEDTYALIQEDMYLINTNSNHTMIIESKEIISDIENGDRLLIKGRSIECLLERRIVWDQTNLNTNIQNGVKTLITDAIINPTLTERKINNFIFVESPDTNITSINIEAQYTGETISDILNELCEDTGLGYSLELDYEEKTFYFGLYFGADRSTIQSENPQVIFSPFFNNIFNSDYYESKEDYKNVALIAGEGEGTRKKTAVLGTTSGLDRREMYVDASDISTQTESGTTITDAAYTNMLIQRGKEQLAENQIIRTFDGEVDSNGLFVFNRDFFLGDIVQFVDNYGNNKRVRVEEYIISSSTTEEKFYPSFTVLND